MCSCKLPSYLFTKTFRIDILKRRTLCQAVDETLNDEKKYKTHARELNAYLSSSKHLLNIKNRLPPRCLKRNRSIPDDLYLIDSVVAKRIASIVLPDIKNNEAEVVETNPGFGFITHRLLKAGITKIHAYEPTVAFRGNLFELDKLYPNRLKIYNKDFFSIWKLAYQDKYDRGDRVKNMLKDIKAKEWDKEAAMNIIGILPNSNFIRHLMQSLIFQHGIMTHGRCNLYICVPPFLYLQWAALPADGFQLYRPSSVLLQIFCDFSIIDKIPRKCFLPWDNHIKQKRSSRKKHPHFHVDPDEMYLIKISFKSPLPVQVEKLQQLWFFTRHLMVSRKNRIIPMLEKWIPGCGWNLITEDPKKTDIYPYLNIYTKIGDLTPAEILGLFKTFISWPECGESSFMASMDSALLKMEHSSEDNIDSNIKDEHPEDEEIKEKKIVDS